jgi:hypothetical protein
VCYEKPLDTPRSGVWPSKACSEFRKKQYDSSMGRGIVERETWVSMDSSAIYDSDQSYISIYRKAQGHFIYELDVLYFVLRLYHLVVSSDGDPAIL